MKMKTTLCAVLLSLTSVSMIACSSGESSKGTKTSVAALDNSLEAQLKTVETEIAELEAQKQSVLADMMTSPEIAAQLSEEAEASVDAYIKASQKLKNTFNRGADSDTIRNLVANVDSAKVNMEAAKTARDEAKSFDIEASKELKIIDIKIARKNIDKDIVDTKIDVKALQNSQKSMTDKNDRDNNELLINRKLKEIEKMTIDQNREDYM